MYFFSTIFGFLAGFAITFGLSTYYDNYITTLDPSKGILLGIIPAITTPNGAIANLHLLDFFVVAIPLVHSGYLFLSSLGVSNIRTTLVLSKNNARIFVPAALVAIFIICIVQAALLFFLGKSIAIASNSTTDNDTTEEKVGLLQSTSAFVSWLTFAIIMATAGSMLVKYIIEKDRIPIEWIPSQCSSLCFQWKF